MNIKDSMDLAGHNLLAVLNPERNYAPTGGWLVTHDTGRWWDAMLRLEEATGFAIPARLEGAMLQNLDRFTDNPDGLLLVPPDLGWLPPKLELHSLREELLAFTALARRRNSCWAVQRARRMLETLQRILRPDGSWDMHALDYARHAEPQPGSGLSDLTGSSGRLIEALVLFHQTTGDALALDLAERMARYHLEHTTTPDGPLPAALASSANMGHSHSYMGTLRGLLRFGLFTGRQEYVARVAAAYRHAVPCIVNESGWSAHDLGMVRFRDRLGNPVPETATAGDAAQLALWLALEAGYTEFLDDVQRLVLSRLLPSQITTADATPAIPVLERELGAYGGVHGLPHGGKASTIDVTDVYRRVAVRHADGLHINLALDYSDDNVHIAVDRAAELHMTIKPRVCDDVYVHMPRWAPAESVRVDVDGRPCASVIGDRAFIGRSNLPGHIHVRHALPVRHTTERTATGGEYHFTWRGDKVVGVSPQDPVRPFYPPA